ncbi:hypothetical protein AAHA92_01639 [Salvia divinorum]|uniref:Uncharacterized protein n=1 Tax=Salvia divinorum TaxID=28513 RepID=A0ABD1IB86_SALDI
MKALSMAILSPGRPENFPLPSRGRSRSSRLAPILYGGGEMESGGDDQEPCSPKVTCIGQVRARKSRLRRRRRFSFLAGGRRDLRRVLRRWVVFIRSGYCKRVDAVAEEECFGGAGWRRKVAGVEGSGKFENVVGVARNGSGFDDSRCLNIGDGVGRVAAESGILGEEGSGNPRNLDDASVGDSEGIGIAVESPRRALSLGEIFLREDVGGGSGDGVAAESGNPRNRSGSVRDSEGIAVESLMLAR